MGYSYFYTSHLQHSSVASPELGKLYKELDLIAFKQYEKSIFFKAIKGRGNIFLMICIMAARQL